MKIYHIIIILFILFIGCAKESRPNGGPVDNEPPKILEMNPKDSSKNFNKKEIVLSFDEYIVLNNSNTEILFSPPLKHPFKTKTKGKQLIISIIDTLEQNTTYNIKLRKSIKDNTEGNSLENKEITFTTGTFFDSLQIKGVVKNIKEEKNLIAYLYDSLNSSYYKTKPLYITEVNSGTFSFNNLKKNTYKLVVINDENNNMVWDKKENIGFKSNLVKSKIKDTNNLKITLYKPIQNKQLKYKYCNYKNIKILIKSKELQNKTNIKIIDDNKNISYQLFKNSDTNIFILNTVFKNINPLIIIDNYDTTYLKCINKEKPYTTNNKIEYKNDTLSIIYNKSIKYSKSHYYFDSIKNNKFSFKNNKYINNIIIKEIKKEIKKIYIILDSLVFFDDKIINDTIEYIIPENKEKKGILTIKGVDSNYIVSIVNEKNIEITGFKIIKKGKYNILFNKLSAGKYKVKTIVDKDKNKIYTPGNLKLNIQPEKIKISSKTIEILDGWDIELDYKKAM